jgi:hypothetical protein
MEIIKKIIDDTHYYFVDGEFFPSVTKILDEAAPKEYGLLNFFKTNTPEEIEEISSKAKTNGTLVHDSCEALLNGIEVKIKEMDQKQKKSLVAFVQWFEEHKPTDYKTEHTVASKKLKVAGTLDFVGTINGKRVIIDFKTNKGGIYYSNKVQIKAYKALYEEMTGEKIDECWILRLGTTHKLGYEFKQIEDVTVDNFVQIYNVYLSLHDGKIPDPPQVDEYPDTLKLDNISIQK